MHSADLDAAVRRAAINANRNQYSYWLSPGEFAIDMCSYDSEIEQEEYHIVEESIVRQGLLKKQTVGYVINIPDEQCSQGLHSWVDDPTVRDGECSRCGEPYGDPD